MRVSRKITTALVLSLWAVSTAWLIRFEAFPSLFSGRLAGYRDLIDSGPLMEDRWMKILFQDRHIGYTHYRIEADDSHPTEHVRLSHRTEMELTVLGERRTVVVTAMAALDVFYELQRFTFTLHTADHPFHLDGRRVGDREFMVVTRTPSGSQRTRLDIPPDVMVFSTLAESAWRNMKPGDRIHARTLDPLSLQRTEITVRALRRERLSHRGEEVDALVLAASYGGAEFLSWLDASGLLLRQETPFGWTLEACPAEEALPSAEALRQAPDLLRATAVPARGLLPDPRSCRRLLVRLQGAGLAHFDPPTHRQEVQIEKDGSWLVHSEAPPFPGPGGPPLPPAEADRYLAPEPFIQSDHPDIVRLARRLAPSSETPAARVRAIGTWVFRELKKTPVVSVPSALDVLRTREGDCNEHTVLFVALSRAAGVPARTIVGLLYMDGAFYYHAWPSVHLGSWVDLDPTFGQLSADATHLALLEGGLAEQGKLISLFGRLAAEILETEGGNR